MTNTEIRTDLETINYTDMKMRVDSVTDEHFQTCLTAGILQDNEESVKDFLDDAGFSLNTWKEIVDGDNDKYSVLASGDGVYGLAKNINEQYQENYDNMLDSIVSTLNYDGSKDWDSLDLFDSNATHNFGFAIRDSIFSGDYIVVYNDLELKSTGHYDWYILQVDRNA